MSSMTNAQTDSASEPRTTDEIIGANVHTLMWNRRETQTMVAPLWGMDQTTLSNKLRGKRPWFASEIVAAAARYGVPVGELFSERPLPDPAPKGSTSDYSSVVSLDNYRSQKAVAHRAVRFDHEGDATARRVHS
jgi:BetR domain-containing protein